MQTPENNQPAGQNNGRQDGGRNGRAASNPLSVPKVVVLGVGFGGLWATRALAHGPVHIRLVDRHNYHTFFPLLYQVGAAELEAEDITYPVRHIFRNVKDFQFYLGNVEKIDLARKVVKTSDQEIDYDYLIIGLGSRPNFYNIPGANEHAFTLKTVDQGMALRNHIMQNFESATCETDPRRREQWLTFNIVGGGPTGVEFAGALAELIHGSLRRDFTRMDMSEARVLLLEASDHLLEGFPRPLGAYARRRLERMGVEVRLNARVVEVEPGSVRLQDGTSLPSQTVVWTAGVRGLLR
jgi:NADH dehydrogenase